jgi:hypothetical protein
MKDALRQISSKVDELLKSHAEDLEEAWANCGEDPLSISFSARIGFDKSHKGTCEVKIRCTKDKIKDSKTFSWSDTQLSLLKKEATG